MKLNNLKFKSQMIYTGGYIEIFYVKLSKIGHNSFTAHQAKKLNLIFY